MRPVQHDLEDEWQEWFRLTPLERWSESMKLWPQYLAQGGSLDVAAPQIHVTDAGVRRPLDMQQVRDLINAACVGLEKHVDADAILAETVRNLYDGVPVEELHKSAILAARALMEKDPAYSQVTARIDHGVAVVRHARALLVKRKADDAALACFLSCNVRIPPNEPRLIYFHIGTESAFGNSEVTICRGGVLPPCCRQRPNAHLMPI